MKSEKLVHSARLAVDGVDYEILVFSRSDSSYVAKTYFSPQDVIINDGGTLESVLELHQRLLPLAVNSRQLIGKRR